MTWTQPSASRTLAISLGANIPSKIGPPISTLKSVRPKIEMIIIEWLKSFAIKNLDLHENNRLLRFRWSPLFETNAIGGPSDQPNFINAALIIDGEVFSSYSPSEQKATDLLKRFLNLEQTYGRERTQKSIHWGPRTLDIDLLSWGDLQVNTEKLILPHPRLTERNFVLLPLAAALNKSQGIPRRIPPEKDWRE